MRPRRGQCGCCRGDRNLKEKLGRAIDDFRVVVEIGIGTDKSIERDDAPDLVERADFVADHGEAVEDHKTRAIGRLSTETWLGTLPMTL